MSRELDQGCRSLVVDVVVRAGASGGAAFALPSSHEKGVEYFDLEQLGQALALRNWREGDRYLIRRKN